MVKHLSMRRSASVWDMSRREAFTLIEVMVAVMIISVVVTALLQLQSNNTISFSHLKKMQQELQYLSLLQGSKYGFENDSLPLDRMVERFDIDDDLRRELKAVQAKVLYRKLQTVDTKEFGGLDEVKNEKEGEVSPLVIEIGRSVLQMPNGSVSVMRVRIP